MVTALNVGDTHFLLDESNIFGASARAGRRNARTRDI